MAEFFGGRPLKTKGPLFTGFLTSALLLGCNSPTSPVKTNPADMNGIDLAGNPLVGRYTLLSILVQPYGDTSHIDSPPAISGTMSISDSGSLVQNVTVNSTSNISSAAILRIESDSIALPNPSGGAYYLVYHFAGDTLTTLLTGSQVGLSYDAKDTWLRTSSTSD